MARGHRHLVVWALLASMAMTSRTEQRAKWGDPIRIEALEGDVDQMVVKLDRIQGTLNKLLWAVVAASITFAAATATMILTLAK